MFYEVTNLLRLTDKYYRRMELILLFVVTFYVFVLNMRVCCNLQV
jgi:hypothetical protein